MMRIKNLNESFRRLYEEACEDCEDELTFEDIDFDPSVEGELTEAKISPEDKYDSDVIRGIYAKMRQPGTKQFSDEETAIMKKYGLDFSRDSWGRRDNTGLVTSDKHPLHNAPIDRSTKHGRYGREDDVNLADRARKRNQRNIDWQYRKSTPRATHDTLNSNGQWGNKKQSWSRAYDDEKMKSDYKDKYNDLYTKKRDIHADKDLLDYQNNTINQYKQKILDLQKQLANIENRRDITQDGYNREKALWKQAIADRRAKKNESLKESYSSGLSRSQLIDLIDEFYGRADSNESTIWQGLSIDGILDRYGANSQDDDPDEGFYNTMSDDQLRAVFDIIRAFLLNEAEYYADDLRGRDLLDKFGIVQSWGYAD